MDVDTSVASASTPTEAVPDRRRLKLVAILIFMGCSLASNHTVANAVPPKAALSRFTFVQYHMGVDARLVVYAKDKTSAETACIAAFARIATLDGIMSDYRKDSELMKLCDKAGSAPVHVSPDLFKVLKRGKEVSRLSNGAFDMTVGPLVALWRQSRKTTTLPDPVRLSAALKLVGWKKVILNDRSQTVKLISPGMKLDLGGIAKGYACDEAQKVLRKHGITKALVEMGGDIVVTDPPPGKKGWVIRVPNAEKGASHVEMPFANKAVSSSGDTEQFVEIDGVRYSHVVDPRTGKALTNRVQVTVIAPNGLTSDPLTKTLCVLPKREGMKVVRHYRGTKAYVRVYAFGNS